ncbi:poly(A) polymerase [Parasphaerochaeta coccoides]|uniref:Poly(A) polymerase n=1 Tax=Parasphaerochaeta coccoides (strain ATCC BAA-1237 / DSM 17374 / SPN1) TaxID=760011 RepID=F4GJB7_PARC1|nr:poly(A) polymerase [Parasphaerochaeta coccoides]AEC01757.1 poly(A) polymerase [Parasphaerochaeta coccoides DSM 17374]
MLIRYKQDERGKSIPVARIYTRGEHGIDDSLIDADAAWSVRKLQQSGAEAYIVGGAVRDLLVGHVPKDFDIATNASPRQVQRMFWNARIIGKRFKLVHLVFNDKILEVSTFRSDEEMAEDGSNNVFGTIEQDARRRDFTINALYYDPMTGHLLDFNDSLQDFKKKRIRSLIPLKETFIEDPVRMIRAIKYAVSTDFSLPLSLRMAIRSHSRELSRASVSRLTEEVNKILASGVSARIFRKLKDYQLLGYMLPGIAPHIGTPAMNASLEAMDDAVMSAKHGRGSAVSRGEMIKALVAPLVSLGDASLSVDERFKEVYKSIKAIIAPMTPSNYEIELACERILRENGFRTPRNCVRPRPSGIRPPGQARRKGGRQESGRRRQSPKAVKPGVKQLDMEESASVTAPGTEADMPKTSSRPKRKRPHRRRKKSPATATQQQADSVAVE